MLIQQLGTAELEVEIVVEGDRRPLPPTIEVSAYRLVQEGLTNTLKHAEASNATVRLSYRSEALDVRILDDGRGDAGAATASIGGHGLIGMRERVSIHGGRLRAGPRPDGGFEVWATFPLNGVGQ